jgi:FkbH-like protein
MLDINITYNTLIKNLKKDSGSFDSINIAILADFASQHLVKALKAVAVEHNIKLNIWEADYDTIATSIYDETSELYSQEFKFILIFQSSFKLYKEFSFEPSKQAFAEEKIVRINALLSLLQERTKAKIVFSNFVEIDDAVYGNFANKTARSFLYQIRRLNVELMSLAIEKSNLFIVDVQSLFSWKGRTSAFNPRLYIHADLIYDLDFIALLAQKTMQVVFAIQGKFKKCIVLDLDNTLWGGIIGDDGIENIQVGDLGLGKAFTNLQIWLRNLKERGIILAVCSKNTEAIAKEPFEKHPGMTLRLADISVFVANWETKVDNILFIQSVLNIGCDSIVFIDDNPFERTIVKQHIPDITVPDLPEDPAEYLPYLQSLSLFETATLSEDDAGRTKKYQEEAGRVGMQKKFTSEAEFLASLQMTAVIKPVDNFTCPRVAQLSQRSNQFNLRTVRYTDEDIKRTMNDPGRFTLTVTMKDVFGDYGLISTVIMEKRSEDVLFIDTWIMSCRVLKRGVENFLLNEIVELAQASNFRFIEGEYIPTAKNGLVKEHYSLLGFQQCAEKKAWLLDVNQYQPKQTFITKSNEYAIHQ